MINKKIHDELAELPAVENPSVQSSQDEINPPNPLSTPDERREASEADLENWSPNARGAGDVRFTSYPQDEAAQNPAAWEGAPTHGDRSLSCPDCSWSVSGKSEEEVLGYMRSHARQAHGKNEFTSAELENARRAIHKRAA